MDIIKACEDEIKNQLEELNNYIDSQKVSDEGEFLQTQTNIEAAIADKDKNLDRILEQQAHIKMIIERDGRIKSLRESIEEDKRAIERLRKSVTKIGLDAIKDQKELLARQAKEVEDFQMQQLKSIADDYCRHQQILEQRRKEIIAIKKETELEEKNREAYLQDVEKNLEKQIQNRQRARQEGYLEGSSSMSFLTAEVRDPNYIELTSIDEYAPYGAAPHSRLGTNPRRGGSARGRKKQQQPTG